MKIEGKVNRERRVLKTGGSSHSPRFFGGMSPRTPLCTWHSSGGFGDIPFINLSEFDI